MMDPITPVLATYLVGMCANILADLVREIASRYKSKTEKLQIRLKSGTVLDIEVTQNMGNDEIARLIELISEEHLLVESDS